MSANPHQKVYELVNMAVSHQLSVPEFQRGFVWKSTQVRDLAESLWSDYPIGSLLIWDNPDFVQSRSAEDRDKIGGWIVDGQQRTTALCLLFGRKPYWWPTAANDWNKTLKRYDVRFDAEAHEPPFFVVANAAIRRAKGDRWIELHRILNADDAALQNIAKEVKTQDLCKGEDAIAVYSKLDKVRKIKDKDLVTITVSHELEDVVEIFSRLNSKGTRVTEADIYLGIVAARVPGWVRDEFLPFLNTIKEYGFDINPNLLFRSLTAIASGKTRFRDIPDNIWNEMSIVPAWKKTQESWKNLLKRLAEYGVLSNDPMPTQAALVTLVALQDKFPNEPSFDLPFYWLLQASRFQRYSGSGSTAMDEDLRDIHESSSLKDAIIRLLARFEHTKLIETDEFQRDYADARFPRFMLYLVVYRNEAKDWDEKGYRLGFEGSQIMQDFKPQWHHIFPKKFLSNKFEDEQINSLANIAVIGQGINIRISNKDPMDYLTRYQITDEKLAQQFIPTDRSEFVTDKFPQFLENRSMKLTEEANKYLTSLTRNL